MVTIERVAGVALPTVRERGVPRRDPAPPDPRPAATAMLKALLPGNEPQIETAVFALAVALAKVQMGTDELPIRMTPADQNRYRALERFWRNSLPRMTREEVRAMCLGVGGIEPADGADPVAIDEAAPPDDGGRIYGRRCG